MTNVISLEGPVELIDGKLMVRIRSSMELDAATRAKLEQAAMSCPVHASLHPSIEQHITFEWGPSA